MILCEKALGFMLSTSCSLNCRLCTASMPQFRERGIRIFEQTENYRRELSEIFNIYDHIGTISISGGEPLLNQELPEIAAVTLQEFSYKFDQFRIITNGTILPDEALLRTIRDYGNGRADFQLDNYGVYSDKLTAIAEKLKEYSIPYHIKKYHGEEQYCGGWIDLGPPDKKRNYSSAEAQCVVDHCRNAHMKCLIVFDGKLFLCPRAITGHALGMFKADPEDFIDLLGQTQTLDKKKKIAAEFGSRPIHACYYCDGYDPENSSRFPAGEQI